MEYFSPTEVIAMLDSRASHNFISPQVVKRLHLKLCAPSSLGVTTCIKGFGLCPTVTVQLNPTSFTSDFISLELGSVDVILVFNGLKH